MKVLIGSENAGKLSDAALYLQGAGLEPVFGEAYALDIAETGSSPQENATIKAMAYAKASGLPTVSFDSGLFLAELPADDPCQPGTHVRRVGGKRLDDEEMIAYYSALAASLGGKVLCQWVTGFAAVMPDGRVISGDDAQNQPDRWKFWLVAERNGEPLKGKPLSCISLEGDTGRYVNETNGQDGASAERRRKIYRRAIQEIKRLIAG